MCSDPVTTLVFSISISNTAVVTSLYILSGNTKNVFCFSGSFASTSLEKRKLCNQEIWTPIWFSLIARCKREQ